MGNLNEFFRDLGRNAYGLGENVASLGSAAIAEPVAGFAAMYDPVNGAQAIREGMTYTPRTQAGQMYQQGAARTLGAIAKPAMPVIETWQRGVDIAGGYSPIAGAMLRTVPAAIGVAMGAKPALQAGRQVSNSLGAMQARMIANANAPRTLNAGYRNQRGVFAGINALTADKEALAKAQDMIAQGVDPAQVWKETGWGKGVDGKWRFEIDDSNAQFTNDAIKELRNKNGKRLGDIFPHQDLSAAYPESSDIWTVKQSGDGASYRGGEMGKSDMISLGIPKRGATDISELKRTNLHEIQHAIQDKEGFATGGNPEQFKNLFSKEQLQDARILAGFMRKGKSLEDALQEYKTLIRREPVSGALTLVRHNSDPDYLNAMTHDPNEAYRRLAGEVEARTTESRVNLNAQQRRDNYPFDYKTHGYDVPANYQNVEFDSKNAMSQRPLTQFEQAHLLAQQRAALPVNQRGLDLPADNTAMDRARAMGWDTDAYHGSPLPDAAEAGNLKISYPEEAVFLADEPFNANAYARSARYPVKRKPQPNVIPVLIKSKNMDLYEFGGRQKDRGFEPYIDAAKRAEKDGVIFNDIIDEPAYGGNVIAILDPKNIRSRFAAFDPFNRDSSDLLAQSAKFAPAATLGALMANEKRKDKRN